MYTLAYVQEVAIPHIPKVFESGNSQTVQLPKDFHFTIDEAEVAREGDAVIQRPRPGASGAWASLRAAVERGFSADFTVSPLVTSNTAEFKRIAGLRLEDWTKG